MRPAAPVRLVLASASSSRRRLLADAGIDAEVMPSGVDESSVTLTAPDQVCGELARRKAAAVAARLRAGPEPPDRVLVLGCDSVLALDGVARGKPRDAAEAVARWRWMRGRPGVLHTGHAVVSLTPERTVSAVSRARVHFAEITDAEIDAYVATGEPLTVAGAFTVEGLGSPFVSRIEGDPGTVMGLSLPLLRELLAQLGVAITDLWRPSVRRPA